MKSVFSNLRLPIVVAPMFLVSQPPLVSACCKAGIVGTFPALNQRTTEGFAGWIDEIRAEVGEAPFGVNLIVHRSNPRLEADLKVCVEKKIPLVITSLGAVRDVVDAVHSYGGLVFHDIINRRHAEKAKDAGVDGLILVSGGAGGHAGTINPFALMAEIRSFFDGTILLAGAISTGRDVAAAIAMGADLAYMGTRFIATHEASAQPEYKQMLVDAHSEDIIYTPAVSGIPANFMRQSLEANGFDLNALTDAASVDFGKKLTVGDDVKAWKTVWSAGHGVGAIVDEPSVHELVERLVTEFEQARKTLA